MNTTIRSQWSIASPQTAEQPLLTSEQCYRALVDYFQQSDDYLLAVTTESSSHPAGLNSLYAQPWVYAGGGLGNMDECPLQVCMAGGVSRDSLTFASVCIVPECDASDLLSEDFPARVETAAFGATDEEGLIHEYVTLQSRAAQVNKFLNTGWVCGEYKVDWEMFPSIIYIGVLSSMIATSFYQTFYRRKKKINQSECVDVERVEEEEKSLLGSIVIENEEEKKEGFVEDFALLSSPSARPSFEVERNNLRLEEEQKRDEWFWSAWDMSKHFETLWTQRKETACLDGLKVGSILWVIFGHVMAIQSSVGPGYLNPKSFLPPDGITTTLFGQLLFSSRFAVDTFLCVSGYLVAHILKRKLSNPCGPRLVQIGLILLYRILRILPLYAMCIGFWVLVAPHLGSGPFWYKWQHFLEPCQKYWWTNLLFMNNFLPWGSPTTDTCFYHSWYLAVDVQLFFLFGPWLAILYNKSRTLALRLTLGLWLASVIGTAILTYQNKWSINTFDGLAVALFDVEGYAKPHVRAQSYLAGMLVAMWPRKRHPNSLFMDSISMGLALIGIFVISFVTVTGAYARRACNFSEWPTLNECGSTWTKETTFLYTAFSRAIWSICIAIIMHVCLQQRGQLVGKILGWRIWTPLAHLSFGAYLIHPMVIFVWVLGGREKKTFHIFSFLMDFISISVASFVLAGAAALIVEFPMSQLLRRPPPSSRIPLYNGSKKEKSLTGISDVATIESVSLYTFNSYGATNNYNSS